jgi:hypothetical protein
MFCWGLDNNLTRNIPDKDPVLISRKISENPMATGASIRKRSARMAIGRTCTTATGANS